MATIKCENCGTMIETNGNDATVFCHNCGTKCESPVIGNNAFLKRGFLALEDGEWTKAKEFFEQSLNTDPECGEGYLGLLMAELKVKTKDDLKNCQKPFDNNNNYSKITRFGSDELKSELEGYINHINERNQAEDVEKDYLAASKIATSSKKPKKLLNASEKLIALGDYKDSQELAETCIEKAKNIAEKNDKKETVVIKIASLLSSVVALLIILSIVITTLVIPTIKYNNAKKLMDEGNYTEAICFFAENPNFKESKTLFAESLKQIAVKETIAAGGCHTVALKSDGTVVAVGKTEDSSYYSYNYYYNNPCDVENWKDIVAIAAGYEHTVGLKADGTVVAVGDEEAYETYTSSYYDSYEILTNSVENWEDIVAIVAGYDYTLGLKSNGTVTYAGDLSDSMDDISYWENIIAIAGNNSHIVGLKADGTVVAEGSTWDDQCDVDDWEDIVAVATGYDHTVGLKADGTVVATGDNDNNQCNVYGWTDIVAIAAGGDFTLGLKADGTVVMVGSISDFQYDIENWTDIVALSVSDYHVVGLKSDGTLVAFGSESNNKCDVDGFKGIKKPDYIR